jgi:hypothetical protein
MTASSRREVGADSRTRFSTLILVSAVAVVIVAVVAAAFIVFSSGGPGPVANGSHEPSGTPLVTPTSTLRPTPTPTRVPTPSPEPTPVARWTGLTWSAPVTPSFVVHVNDLLPWGDGYVAAGELVISETHSDAAFLTSADGLNWTVRYHVDPGAGRFPRRLVATGGELLAFGHPNIVASEQGEAAEPLLWRSADGVAWSAAVTASWRDAWIGLRVGPMPASWDQFQHPIQTGLVDVVGGPAGLVAIGNSYGPDGLVPVVLHSTDGNDWATVRLPAGAVSPLLSAVVAYGDGFVLVGAVNAGPSSESATPAAWYSSDGVSWSGATVNVDPRLFPLGITGTGEMGDVTAGSDGLVGWWGLRAMTAGGPRFTALWTSSDGRTWEPREASTVRPSLWHGYVAGDGVRIVALGPAPNMATDPAGWPGLGEASVSTDGVTWNTLSMPSELRDVVDGVWIVPDGVIYSGVQSFWFGTPTQGP